MTYSAMTAKATGDLITETEWDKIKENFDHLAAMLFGASALSALTAGSQLGIVTGTYTGDGAATKAITGVGFQPRYLEVWAQVDGQVSRIAKSSSDGTKTAIGTDYEDDHVISFGADGFTVGDGTGGTNGNQTNINLRVYTYVAWR